MQAAVTTARSGAGNTHVRPQRDHGIVAHKCVQVRDIQAGASATCMVLDQRALGAAAGGAVCMGLGYKLGANTRDDSYVPLPVVGLSDGTNEVRTMLPGAADISVSGATSQWCISCCNVMQSCAGMLLFPPVLHTICKASRSMASYRGRCSYASAPSISIFCLTTVLGITSEVDQPSAQSIPSKKEEAFGQSNPLPLPFTA